MEMTGFNPMGLLKNERGSERWQNKHMYLVRLNGFMQILSFLGKIRMMYGWRVKFHANFLVTIYQGGTTL